MVGKKVAFINVLVFIVTAVAAFLVTRLILGGSTIPGQIIYDASLSDAQIELIKEATADLSLTRDLTISAQDLDAFSTAEHTLLYDILVPLASDPYYPAGDITRAELAASSDVTLQPISQLSPAVKLLSLDGAYYLDDFTAGAVFQTLFFEGPETATVLEQVARALPERPSSSNILSFAQTGVTALTRGLNDALSDVEPTYFSADIANFLSSKDLTHVSNEVSFSDNCITTASSLTLCSDWRLLDNITAIGADIVELTGNHNIDYGVDDALATLDRYQELGLKTFGGGRDAAAAAEPLQLSQKNTRIALLGYNYSTTTASYGGATTDTPGANLYDEDTAASDIATAKARGDFVIVDVQFFECFSYPADGGEYPYCDEPIDGVYQGEYYNQIDFFRHLIDLGADLVVGTSAHQPQTYEFYQDKPIYYGLGNLFFDQTSWPGTTRGLILTHYFMNGTYLQTRLTPTYYDDSYQVHLMDAASSAEFINRLSQAKP